MIKFVHPKSAPAYLYPPGGGNVPDDLSLGVPVVDTDLDLAPNEPTIDVTAEEEEAAQFLHAE